jgi:hypothetical protein
VVICITASSDNVEGQYAHRKWTIRTQLYVSALKLSIIHLSMGMRLFTLRTFPSRVSLATSQHQPTRIGGIEWEELGLL